MIGDGTPIDSCGTAVTAAEPACRSSSEQRPDRPRRPRGRDPDAPLAPWQIRHGIIASQTGKPPLPSGGNNGSILVVYWGRARTRHGTNDKSRRRTSMPLDRSGLNALRKCGEPPLGPPVGHVEISDFTKVASEATFYRRRPGLVWGPASILAFTISIAFCQTSFGR